MKSVLQPGWAAEGSEALRHPLLSEGVADLLTERAELTAEDQWRELLVLDGWMEDEEGRVTTLGGASWRVQEALPPGTFRSESGAPASLGLTLSPSAQAWWERAEPSEGDLWLSVDPSWQTQVSTSHEQALALLRGEVGSVQAYRRVRAEAIAARKAAGEAALRPLEEWVVAAGGEVLERVSLSGNLRVHLWPDQLEAVLGYPGLVGVDLDHPSQADAGYSMLVEGPVDGEEAEDLLQVWHFYDQGFRGDPSERVVVTEPDASTLRSTHLSFLDGGANRRILLCGGSGPTCVDSAPTVGLAHATRVASVLLSDLTLGQDPAFSGLTARRQRSGVARRTKGLAVDDSPRSRLVDVSTADPDVFLLNHSASYADDDELCSGATAVVRDYHAMFEAGIAVFNSDGNQGFSTPPSLDCLMSSPSTGIGVFAVSGYRVEDLPDASENLMGTASQGGTSTEGGGRVIKAMVGPTGHTLRAEPDEASDPQYSSGRFGHSSGATPAVTGSAALFRQWYAAHHGAAIDDPGLLYTALLLMGDRTATTGFLSVGYDSLWGAGKLRMRSLDAAGMDAPAGWILGSVCVDGGQSVFVEVANGQRLPAGVDYLKAVTWLYDRDHDDLGGSAFDKVDLVVQRRAELSDPWTDALASTFDDHRQRVFLDSEVGSYYFRLKLVGKDVTSDYMGCGTNSNRVYVGLLFESNDRDDDPELNTYVRPEEG